jgi:glycosyltransferase involved in cell wall biosynthesis
MRILFTRFPLESAYGGAEVQTLSFMQELLRRRNAVAFLGSCPTILKLCWDHAIPAAELDVGAPPVTKWSALSFAWRRQRIKSKLEAALRELHELDAIIMLSLTEKLLLTPLALKKGITVLWVEHDGVGRWLTRNPWLTPLRDLANKVTTVTVSDLGRKLYLSLGWPSERTVAIPNGIDMGRLTPPAFPPTEEEATFEPPGIALHLGTLARLTEDKGIDVLLEAVTDLPTVALTIVGRGRDEGYLRSLILERNLSDRVRIIPSVSNISAFYHSLDAFILPSRAHDPFGLVAAEAMMLGIPTVVTDACGIASHIEKDKDALVVEANSPPALKEAIVDLFSKERRASLAHSGKCTARERFSLERMVDAYEALLQK